MPRSSVAVEVNGKPWRLVPDFEDAGPRDRVFSTSQTPDGTTIVVFGDGVHGALPPVGSEIAVRYRTGGGAAGNTATVTIRRTASNPTSDQALWVAIRNRSGAIRFEFMEKQP